MDSSKYVGIPFMDKGRTIQGADCWGLVRIFYKYEFGIGLPSYLEAYASASEIAEVSALIDKARGVWLPVAPGQEREGDIIIMRIQGQPTHVGIILKRGTMLHIMKGIDAMVERYSGPMWSRRIEGFVRHRLLA